MSTTIQKTRRFKTKVRLTRTQGKFTNNTAAIQARVDEEVGEKSPPRRADGAVSLNYDWLAENLPTDVEDLQLYLQHEKLKKLLTTYLDLYSQVDEVFPRINILRPRSGRTSYSNPNVQNIPKRKWGIRSLIVPRSGFYFARADYTAQELVTLAQAMIDLGIGRGPMYDSLAGGLDPHKYGASVTLGKDYEDITKEERQGQKVLAFGVPGGLGPKKLRDYAFATFGVRWTVAEARRRRSNYLEKFWDVEQFLQSLKRNQNDVLDELSGHNAWQWRQALECGWNVVKALCEHMDPDLRRLGEQAARCVPGRLRTGRVRSSARFTEIANSHFQGLAADVTKRATWLLWKEGVTPTLVVHDEIIAEYPKGYSIDEAKLQLERCMLDAFIDICPDLGPHALVEADAPLYKWGGATDRDGNDI